MTDTVTPTQADRDAGAGLAVLAELKDAIRQGRRDETEYVQSFARHRLAAIATQAAEIARLRDALGNIVDGSVSLEAAMASVRAALSAQPSADISFCKSDECRKESMDMQKARPTAAIEQLRDHQRQLDADGCFVGVSRQAIDEVLQFIGEAQPSEQEGGE